MYVHVLFGYEHSAMQVIMIIEMKKWRAILLIYIPIEMNQIEDRQACEYTYLLSILYISTYVTIII